MFTIKATYRNETRKFSFSATTFPTFEQLCNQLFRVFPLSQSYYLSKLLFSPNAVQGGRILIGREVHTCDDYNKSIGPYKERLWPQGLLRFSVYDETPRKVPSTSQESVNSFEPCFLSSLPPVAGSSSVLNTPVAYSASSVSSAMDVDHGLEGAKGKATSSSSCCSVQSARRDIQGLITSFKEDLDYIVKTSFPDKETMTPSPPPSTLPLFPPSALGAHYGAPGHSPLCSACAQSRQCSWSVCDCCHIVECVDCSGKSPSLCFGTMGDHRWRQYPKPPAMYSRLGTQPGSQGFSVGDTSTSMPWSTSGDITPRREEGSNPIIPFIPPPITPVHPGGSTAATAPLARSSFPVHLGVICDSCENVIEGVRHKCLDCSDYDLCSNCIRLGGAERHNPFHEFFEITTPGRVIVHRVNNRGADAERGHHATGESDKVVSHYATCDLCDSRIEGDRYKCLDCPDFDTCSSCFGITEIQHPGHGFARLRRQEDYIKRNHPPRTAHFAACNICTKRIYGVRFKCMHPDCSDFDLCDLCEAHPIPLHPETHPLLKLKTPNGPIPEVCHPFDLGANENRQPDIVPDAIPGNGDQHAAPIPPEPTDSTRNPFVWGYMQAPSSDEFNPRTPLVQPTIIPRLDEISPSIIHVPSLEGQPPPSSSESVKHIPANPIVGLTREGVDKERSKVRAESPSPDNDIHTSGRPTWPGSVAELAHLMASVSFSRGRSSSSSLVHLGRASEVTPAVSPLTGEETLLKPPVEETPTYMRQKSSQPVTVSRHTLAMLLNGYQSPSSVESFSSAPSVLLDEPKATAPPSDASGGEIIEKPLPEIKTAAIVVEENHKETVKGGVPEAAQKTTEEARIYLSAMFVKDITVTDGQIFPPGAEFMKCWRMLNDSEHDWPETTELVYIAGETLGMKKDSPVRVGSVEAGTEVELWTGELKAPDVAGRYVSYWRLRDGNGGVFGDSIWIDITVADAHLTDESDKSIAASLVVMPQSVHTVATERSNEGVTSASAPVPGQSMASDAILSGRSPTVATLSLPSSSSVDGVGSDTDSEVSLVSIPSSGDGEVWEDVEPVRDATTANNRQIGSEGIDYVLLYDDWSSEDE